MSNKGIEVALGFTSGEVEKRMDELRKKFVGIEELEIRLKEFATQPWPFLTYLSHYFPNEFMEIKLGYEGYDGAINSRVLREKFKDYYVMSSLLFELNEKRRLQKTS